MQCLKCGKELTGRQKKFCCKKCKQEYYKDSNNGISYNTVYSKKKDYHGLYLKYKLILARGGKCEKCGYDKNMAALQFHHLDPKEKLFELDSRTIERKKDREIIEEFNKCILLCANCHSELHHPDLLLEDCSKFKELSDGIKYREPHNLDDIQVPE